MTEVPEHLLQRSRERRAALGLGGSEGATPPAADTGGEVPPGASAAAPAQVQAAAAPVAAAPPPPPPPKPVPPHVRAAYARPKIPMWAVPVLAVLPVWAIVYAGTMTVPEVGITDPVLLDGEELYASECAGCHGAAGQGGQGRPLDNGEVLATFPDPEDHMEWIVQGTDGVGDGNPYGNPDRPGGVRLAGSFGLMPGFPDLTEEELIAVTRYEREVIGGEEASVLASGEEGGEGGAEPSTDSPENEAETEGGNVGGEGGEGSESDASPGGGEDGPGAGSDG